LSAYGRNNIIFVGRFVESEILTGPEKFSKRIFENIRSWVPSVTVLFIQYFFDGRKHSLREKMFGFLETEYNGLKVYRAGLFSFYRLLKKLKPAIIHITVFERFAVIALLYSLLNRTKIVYTCNGVVRYENSELKKVSFLYRLKDSICERLLFRFSDTIVFPSGAAYELAKEYFDNVDIKGAVIPHGIDDIFVHASKNPVQSFETGKKLKAVFIYKNELNASGLNFLKDLLKAAGSKFTLYIICQNDINFKGINADITLIKPMNTYDLAEFYRDKDIFLSLNEYDTFSISAIEAMASGVIPVVTNQTGMSIFITNEINGYKIEFGDTTTLTEVIGKLQLMGTKEHMIIKQKATTIYERWNWHKAAGTYLHEYRQLTGDLYD